MGSKPNHQLSNYGLATMELVVSIQAIDLLKAIVYKIAYFNHVICAVFGNDQILNHELNDLLV